MVGTIGGRLHFKDNTIQHDGIFIVKNINTQELNLVTLGYYLF